VPDPTFTEDEARVYVASKTKEMFDAAQTKEGRMAEERTPRVKQTVQKVVQPSAIKYPAH